MLEIHPSNPSSTAHLPLNDISEMPYQPAQLYRPPLYTFFLFPHTLNTFMSSCLMPLLYLLQNPQIHPNNQPNQIPVPT